ncbi:MAG TPA: hypothetical protein VD947_03395 [Patescibacteria group bacterium]|nr:hypothetical protein [Patescibacteria group bacterium]
MKPNQLKKLAINTMIVSLIGSAVVAVIAVLIGEFNDILGKSLFTLLVVTLHALVCLGFLDSKSKTNNSDDLKFFTNTIFVLIVLSFVTATFGIWELFSGSLVAKLYGTYFIAAFATFHGEMLHKTTGLDTKINNIVYANYILMGLVIILLLPLLWMGSEMDFPDFYYRLLAASAIVDATLTILAVILHKLYLQKHPELKSQLFTKIVYTMDANGNKVPQAVEVPKRRMHPLLVILVLFLLLQFVAPIIFLIAGLFVR